MGRIPSLIFVSALIAGACIAGETETATPDTGFGRSCGRNPYVSYDSAESPLTGYFTGEVDDRQPEMARVVGIHLGSDSIAVPFSRLRARGEVALEVADGADVGAVGVFRSETTEGRAASTPGPDGDFVDDLTGSSWNILGEAVEPRLPTHWPFGTLGRWRTRIGGIGRTR